MHGGQFSVSGHKIKVAGDNADVGGTFLKEPRVIESTFARLP
jgi:hypothetical protein